MDLESRKIVPFCRSSKSFPPLHFPKLFKRARTAHLVRLAKPERKTEVIKLLDGRKSVMDLLDGFDM